MDEQLLTEVLSATQHALQTAAEASAAAQRQRKLVVLLATRSGMTQEAVAIELGISTPNVTRLVKEAREL